MICWPPAFTVTSVSALVECPAASLTVTKIEKFDPQHVRVEDCEHARVEPDADADCQDHAQRENRRANEPTHRLLQYTLRFAAYSSAASRARSSSHHVELMAEPGGGGEETQFVGRRSEPTRWATNEIPGALL